MKLNPCLAKIIAFVSSCALFASGAAAVSVSTDPVSVMSYTFPSKTDRHIGIPLIRPSVYEGRIDAVDLVNSQISFQGNPGWEDNVFTETGPHFVYIKTGVEEGMWLTINANSGGTVTVQLRIGDALENVVSGEVAAIVPHWTPKTLFGTAPVEGVFLYLYRSFGAGINHAPSFSMVHSEGEWYSMSDFSVVSDAILFPHEALVVRNGETEGFTLNNTGVVPMAMQRTAIRTKVSGVREEQRIAFSSVLSANIGNANIPAKEGDFLYAYSNNGGINDAPSFSFVYSEGIWYSLKDFSNANNNFQLKPGFSYLYRKEPTTEPEVVIWRNLQAYLD